MGGNGGGTDGFILASTDSGLTWNRQLSGVASDLYSVRLFDSTHAIASGTNGTILVTSNGGVSWVSQSLPPPPLLLSTFPDPAASEVTIQYTLPIPQHVTLSVYDLKGSVVAQLLDNVYTGAGQRMVTMATAQLPAGDYNYSFQSEQYTHSGSFTVLH